MFSVTFQFIHVQLWNKCTVIVLLGRRACRTMRLEQAVAQNMERPRHQRQVLMSELHIVRKRT